MKNEKVGFLGPFGSYSHQAALKYNPSAQLCPYETIQETIRNINDCTTIIVPFYNSTVGYVQETVDALYANQTELRIVQDLWLEIQHCLLAATNSSIREIKTVYSHLKALEQCSLFLKTIGAELVPVSSTAEAAILCRNSSSENIACVGSLNLAELYGLHVLNDNINNICGNQTRFLVFQSKTEQHIIRNSNETIILFQFNLNQILNVIVVAGMEITKLYSRVADSNLIYLLEFKGYHKELIKSLEEQGATILGTFESQSFTR